ncbi:MAG: alpha/beta fold hydrolase [Ornithinimicrobium sp.]
MIPADLPGLDPAWSRWVTATGTDGQSRQWHVLDTHAATAAAAPGSGQDVSHGRGVDASGGEPAGTVLCVHGNPTWSYLWRRVLAGAPRGWRVVAVDQLGMGYSERPEGPRRLSERVDDLSALTEAMGLRGPIVVLAHDWGGPISMGWTLRHAEQVAAVVLTNTAVYQDEALPRPMAITATRSRPALRTLTSRTPAFVAATTALSRPSLPKDVRTAFAAPYKGAGRRRAVQDFVADIPFEREHPSYAALQHIAAGVADLRVPALLVWGTRDPVFSRRYLEDLKNRLPQADVQVYPRASHLVLEDAPEGVDVIWSWIREQLPTTSAPEADAVPLTHAASTHAPDEEPPVELRVSTEDPHGTAIVELGSGGASISRGELSARVELVARALAARGVTSGQRVAVLIPPGIDLNTVVYAVWRLGAVIVIADAGLGLARLGAALRSTSPDHVIGIRPALLLARVSRVAGEPILADADGVCSLIAEAAAHPPLEEAAIEPDALAAILFTSGATGPPKGVVYSRRQLRAQVSLLAQTFELNPGQRLVAAFAPFALYGPPLGLACAVPDMDVTAPHTLTATALAEAIAAVDATAVFASPAALRNVIATADVLRPAHRRALAGPRLVMSAGAPVPTELLRAVKELMPAAATHTPYGMTEVLPVATIDPTTIEIEDAAGPGGASTLPGGVCVGHPLRGVSVAIDTRGPADVGELTQRPGVFGEIVVSAPHVKSHYHAAWAAQQASAQPPGWHRTGDVGVLDQQGRLWVQGRLVHVLDTASGPLPPYPLERALAALPGIADVAVVGVGPRGSQQCVVIVVPEQRLRRRHRRLAEPAVASAVRALAGQQPSSVQVAAVLQRDWLPVDIRHASKIDRTGLARWADEVLHGRAEDSPRGVARIWKRPQRQPGTKSR